MFNKEERDFLLRAARNAIKVHLETGQIEIIPTSDPLLKEGRGAFVTLHKGAELRGCIGLLESGQPLDETVCQMAVEAAVNDPRFPAVSLSELAGLKIEISILTRPVRVSGPEAIVMMRDGVIVRRGNCRGVFLPQVAEETGWDKEKFLSVLCADKAGLPADAWKEKDTEIYTFQAEVFSEG
ncbi:MAG: AmmeMemoRadiSam system protein A [Candidatus Omnitrophota bacterium]